MTDDDYDPTELYPAGICVFCDLCRTEIRGDFVVNDLTSRAERFEIARRHFTANNGWSCTPDADLCPDCAAKTGVTTARSRVYHRTSTCRAFTTGQALSDVDCGCDTQCGHRLPMTHAIVFVTIAEAVGLRPCAVCRPPLPPAYHHGHQPQSTIAAGFMGDMRPITITYCARCVVGLPSGHQVAVPWPCSTARVLGLEAT